MLAIIFLILTVGNALISLRHPGNKKVKIFDEKLTTENFDVYIEFTDAFGMLYNSNIPLMMERAMASANGGPGRIVAAKSIKFRKPARLGDKLEVVVKHPLQPNCETFGIKIGASRSFGGLPSNIQALSHIGADSEHLQDDWSEEIASGTGIKFCKDRYFQTAGSSDPQYQGGMVSTFRVWDDELGPGGSLTTKTIFNLLERARSDAVGGPKALARSASEAVHFYVARVADYELVSDYPLGTPLYAGARLHVLTIAEPIGTLMVDFLQEIVLSPAEHAHQPLHQAHGGAAVLAGGGVGAGAAALLSIKPVVLARARVTVAGVDAATGAPMPIPDILLERLFGTADTAHNLCL